MQRESILLHSVVSINTLKGEITLHRQHTNCTFIFDYVYHPTATQSIIYNDLALPILHCTIQGYNGAIIAYGQTGSGKSHTIEGVNFQDKITDFRGILPRSIKTIFSCIGQDPNKIFYIRSSFYSIYNNKIKDLLCPQYQTIKKLTESKHLGVVIKDIIHVSVKNEHELLRLFEQGMLNLSTEPTQMSSCSSRETKIFNIYVECAYIHENKILKSTIGKLAMVDLEGSEGIAYEQNKMTLSIAALSNVISTLADSSFYYNAHYMDSILTTLLQENFGGNSKTVFIGNISPAESSYEESLSTIRLASKTKYIVCKPKINTGDSMIIDILNELNELKKKLIVQYPVYCQKYINENDVFELKPSGCFIDMEYSLNKTKEEVKVQVVDEKMSLSMHKEQKGRKISNEASKLKQLDECLDLIGQINEIEGILL